VGHGQWRAWLADNVGMPERTASAYMKIARSGLKSATVAEIGIRGALALLGRQPIPRPDENEAVLVEAGREIEGGFREHTAIVRPAADRFHVSAWWLPPEREPGGCFDQTKHPVPYGDPLRLTIVQMIGSDSWQSELIPQTDPIVAFMADLAGGPA
jgi:hypothetical protein